MKKLLTLLVYGLAAALIAACSPATQQSPDAPAASGSAASGTRMVKDSSGNDVEIPAEVTKVAPTIGAFSAVTAMLGASNKIVAAATSALSPRFKATYPDYEKANPNGYDTKNVEDIIASGAQVVYGPGTLTEEQLAQLKGAGIAFVAIEKLSTVEEMSQAFTIIGNILGGDHQKKAEELVKLYKGNVDDTAKRTASLAGSDRVPVLQLRAEGNEYSTIKLEGHQPRVHRRRGWHQRRGRFHRYRSGHGAGGRCRAGGGLEPADDLHALPGIEEHHPGRPGPGDG